MKKPVVDYRKLRLRTLRTPAYSHLLLLLGWVAYFALYFITENLIPAERCHVIHCALDDAIPFCEWFVLPYVLWYALVAGSLAWFVLYDIGSFRALSVYIMVTQALGMACYILYPSIQLLRPAVFPRDNVLTRIIGFLYSFDTPTGVLPSLHVAYSLGLISVWFRSADASRLWKGLLAVLVAVIILATFFIKQHSVLDALAAIPVCAAAELVVCLIYRRKSPEPDRRPEK